jgi:hypothetical protein
MVSLSTSASTASRVYRAVLHAAFAFSLLHYCQRHGTPHPGFLVIDSPLTPFKMSVVR